MQCPSFFQRLHAQEWDTETRARFGKRVEVGAFGRFRFGGKKLVETWTALERIAHDVDWWMGIYSAYNLLEYGKNRGLLTDEEVSMFQEALKS